MVAGLALRASSLWKVQAKKKHPVRVLLRNSSLSKLNRKRTLKKYVQIDLEIVYELYAQETP